MLPDTFRQCYEELRHSLEQAATIVAQPGIDQVALKAKILDLKTFFDQQVMELNADELEPTEASYVFSINVEINKQLRLLGMDGMFLQAARQSSTASQRQEQISDRLQMLMRYCDALLQKN